MAIKIDIKEKLHILLLEDEHSDAELIKRNIRQSGIIFSSVIASDKDEFIEAVNTQTFDIILADNSLLDFSSEDAIQYLEEKKLGIPVILVTGTVSEEFAVNILQKGADDYILKHNMERLPAAIKTAIGKRKIKAEKDAAIEELYLSEQKYKLLFISSPIPMCMFSLNTLDFIAVNNAMIEHYGYSREDFLKMSTKDIRPIDDVEKFVTYIIASANGKENRGIWRHKKKNGDIIFVEVQGNDIIYDNQPVRLALLNDITERLYIENKLKETLEETRHLAASLQSVREEERTTMAREIHDQLGQILTGLRLEISMIKSKTPDKSVPLKEMLSNAIQTTDEVIATVRKIASRLRPALLDDMGLGAAMEWQSREFRKSTGISCIFSEEGSDDQIDKNTATGLFRLYQEALTNIIRHASATKVETFLMVANNKITLTITDNGKGFKMEEVKSKKTLGLTGMKERVYLMHGEFELVSNPEKGTVITVKVAI